MYWNPATITMAPGFQGEFHASAIIPETKITPTFTVPAGLAALGPSGDIGLEGFLPAGYASYQVNDRLWLGLYTGGPFGLATKPREIWAGQLYARTTSIFSLEAMPTIGYKVNDWLSVGAGRARPVSQGALLLGDRTDPCQPIPFAASAGLEGDNVGFGYSLGATLTPFVGTSIGVGFRSGIEHDLEGSFQYFGVPIKAELVLPES